MGTHDLSDIQGYIFRGYNRMRSARHFLLTITDPARFCTVLGELAGEPASTGIGRVQDASEWEKPGPAHCVNIAFTRDGLAALGLSEAELEEFPAEFRMGAVGRAERIGDVGDSAPEAWRPGVVGVHAILSLYARDQQTREAHTDRIVEGLGDAVASPIEAQDADRLEGKEDKGRPLFHFGYRDGFSQPSVVGMRNSALPDPFPVPVDEILIGHDGAPQGRMATLRGPELARNGTFGAFRILEQDVRGFEEFLERSAAAPGTRSKEWFAAKVCGRWRNGLPVLLSPDLPVSAVAEGDWNMFDYVDDPNGERCPVGSHIRRAFPRGDVIAGGDDEGHRHRMIRRGMPYGPVYEPGAPEAEGGDPERGLVGFFFGASLRDQFEFVTRNWLGDGTFTALGRHASDVFVGPNDASTSTFLARPGPGQVRLRGFSRFVTTRGSAYCFVPSLTALRTLAAQQTTGS